MKHDYLMNVSSVVFIICYIPELYANWKNKNANIYNIPEKVLMLVGTGFAFSYAIINNDVALMTNYGPILMLDVIALLMRVYYVRINHNRNVIDNTPETESRTPEPPAPSHRECKAP
jgi:hypothetical protein